VDGKMKHLAIRDRKSKILKVTILSCVFLLSVIVAQNFETANQAGRIDGFLLIPSAFAQSVDMTFLVQEAGISAYINFNQTLDMSLAKTIFKTVEKETSTYIIGSISLPNLPETDDPHVFIHKEGWILIYYLRGEPLAKIINWNNLASTKLEEGLLKICNALGLPSNGTKYFNFRYPKAEKLMIIIDYDSFKIKIPSSFVIYEMSYSVNLAGYSGWYSSTRASFSIDGTEIAYSYGREIKIGLLTLTQLKPELFHTIDYASADGAIVLTYKEG